jgi:hypothetical protein
MKNTMKKILLLTLALVSSTSFAALTEVDKSIYSERNLILNPGFENGKNSWLSSSATLTATTTAANVLYGAASGSILISSNGGYVRTKTVAVPTALYGQACEARVLYKGGDALTTFEVYNRDNELLGSLALKALSAPGYESVFFPCPTSTQVSGDADKGFIYAQIKQTSAGTHTVMYTDSWYMGGLTMLGESTLPDVFSAKVDGTVSPSTVSDENSDWLNGNCTRNATGDYTCNFNSGIFSLSPNCVLTGNATAGNVPVFKVLSVTSSAVNISVTNGSATAQNHAFQIYCMKQGVDAKQSVQVYKSIPKVADNINAFSSKISSTGTVSDENADWLSGNCSWSLGEASCTFVANTFTNTPNCFCTPSVNNADNCVVKTVSSSAVTFKNYNGGVGTNRDIVARCEKAGTDFKMPVVQPIFSPASIVGAVVGSAYFETGAVATGTGVIPTDDTIPQNTEGTEFMTLAYTPKSASNLLRIKVVGNFSYSTSAVCNMALFQDSTANAIGSTLASIVGSNGENITLVHYMLAGTTSSTTFKMRAGCGTAGTLTFNGVGGGRYYGGTMASSITIEEIQQ